MTFTDDDLKLLKELVAAGTNVFPHMNIPQLKALIARLEAAEWAMSELERHARKGYLHGDLVAPLEAWRKAAGK